MCLFNRTPLSLSLRSSRVYSYQVSLFQELNLLSLLDDKMPPPADSYLAIPPGDHCLSGNLHTGDTRGKLETIEEAPTYITSPHLGKGNGNILFYYPDVHGFYNNAMLLMDAFADAGYTVFGIDYFRDVITSSNVIALMLLIKYRIRFGNTEKTKMIKPQTQASTTQHGETSMPASPEPPCQNGPKPLRRHTAKKLPGTVAWATASARHMYLTP